MLEEANPLLLSTEKEVHAVPRATRVSLRLLHGCVARGNRMQIIGKTSNSGRHRNSSPAQSSQAARSTISGAMKPTNIVLITLDTVRADHLHCYGNAKIKTPTIDALASSGVLFEKAVAQAPLTLPSHASMFTGTNPNVHHVRDTGGFVLQPSSVTMATILREHGWNTAAFVSAVVFKRAFGFQPGLLDI